jgi:hypothetical protein
VSAISLLLTVTTYNKVGAALEYNKEFSSYEGLIEWMSSDIGGRVVKACDEVRILVIIPRATKKK